MPAKSLNEAISRGMCIGPMSSMHLHLKSELRDFLAHQIMYEVQKYPPEVREYVSPVLLEFFNRIFND